MKAEKFKTLQELSNFLNKKYSKVSDFETVARDNKISGGFYKMTYFDRLAGGGWQSYYFHETFGGLSKEQNINTLDELYVYLNRGIQMQLRWQKKQDELYAAEFNKKIEYKFDYSVIEN